MTTEDIPWMSRGDTPTWEVKVLQYDGGPVFNLTGCEMWFTAKKQINDTDSAAVFQLTQAGGQIVFTDAVNGVAEITPQVTSTNTLTADMVVYWDVQIRTPGPNPKTHTPIRGAMLIKRDITRA